MGVHLTLRVESKNIKLYNGCDGLISKYSLLANGQIYKLNRNNALEVTSITIQI